MKKGIKELTDGMQRLCAVANRIVSDSNKVSRIEVDLLMDDLRRLYDVALTLRDESVEVPQPHTDDTALRMPSENDEEALLSSTMMATRAAMAAETPETPTEAPESQEPAASTEVPQPQEVAAEPEPPAEPEHIMAEVEAENGLMFDEVIIESTPAPTPEPESEPAPEPEPEPEPETAEQPTLPFDDNPEPQAEQTPEPAEEQRQPSLLDYLRHTVEETPTVRTLGDTLGGSTPAAGSTLERKVSDLRTVININDKFSFMTELFRGNMKAYNDFIMQLNDMDDRDEALRLVADIAEQYHWEDDSVAVSNFYKVFDKKF